MGFVICACERPPEWRHEEGVGHWKLLAFGEGKASDDSIGLMKLNVEVYDEESGIKVLGHNEKTFLYEADPLWKFLTGRLLGDSLELRFGTPNFLLPDLPAGDTAHAFISLLGFKTMSELRDARKREYMQLDTLLRHPRISEQFEEYRGVWIRTLEEPSDTLRVQRGREVVIHYRGTFLDGTLFDDSRRMESPLYFTYGNESQVLKGLEIALERMQKGQIVDVILPSWLAFGKKGSIDGRVPPYTPVRYTLEVVEIGL